jgi:DNA-binding transcriptional regulator of glucitol operon
LAGSIDSGVAGDLTYRHLMARSVRRVLTPRWLALHLLVIALVVTMVLLGRWQWRVAHVRHGALQNYSYAFQWWIFTVFALLMWVRVLRDGLRERVRSEPMNADGGREASAQRTSPARGDAPEPMPYRRYVPPPVDRLAADDPERAAYNAYLAGLARAHEEGTGSDARSGSG